MKTDTLLIVGGFGLALAGFLIINRFFNKVDSSSVANAALYAEPDERSYAASQMLHQVMRQCWRKFTLADYFTDNPWIDSDEEFLKLYSAFGIRPYDKCIVGFPDFFYPDFDLLQWMYQISDSKERNSVNEIFKNRGISFRLPS